jgi:hypothetical protein
MRELDHFLNARNLLIKQRTNYEAAYAEFSWPKLDTFNWAIDYFDAIAQNNSAPVATTCAPSAWKACAIASPMPLVAPVIKIFRTLLLIPIDLTLIVVFN